MILSILLLLPMPPSVRIRRHYRLLTNRSLFSPERLLTPPPSTLRTSFLPQNSAALSHQTDAINVLKPVGEPGREYNLKEAMGITDTEFMEIQVCVESNR